MTLPLIPQDKANHAIYGAVIFLFVAFFTTRGHAPHPFELALAASALAGALKELSDYIANQRALAKYLPDVHSVEAMDFLATALGGLACYAATALA